MDSKSGVQEPVATQFWLIQFKHDEVCADKGLDALHLNTAFF